MTYVNNKLLGFTKTLNKNHQQQLKSEVQQKERELEGQTKNREEDIFNILEFHTNLDIEGFEDVGEDGEPTGIKLPYIVTLEENSREVLSIKRNYEVDDVKRKKYNTLYISNFYQV
jgi:hypothetical protein